MGLVLLNLKSNQTIQLDNTNPLIIGRKNVEGCYDSKVSRNHGRITCTDDGKIRLTALHNNPCFYTIKDIPQIIHQLNKNNEKTLSEGDSLGLLPNEYWFKIISNSSSIIKTESDTAVEETTCTADKSTSQLEHRVGLEALNSTNSKEIEIESENQNLSVLSESKGSAFTFGDPEFEKTKRLPLHMYEIDDLPLVVKNTNKRSLPKEDETEKSKNLEVDVKSEPEINDFDGPTCSKVTKIENLSRESLAESQDKCESTQNNDNGENSSVKRPLCQYEGRCYRANPEHKLEYSHPGDEDFVPYEQRPLCPYGAACYRKNQRHKVENRHPPCNSTSERLSPFTSSCSPASSPLPAKRTRKKIVYNFGSQDDEYDLEDPFINDFSSDDYAPSDAESEEEEDILTD